MPRLPSTGPESVSRRTSATPVAGPAAVILKPADKVTQAWATPPGGWVRTAAARVRFPAKAAGGLLRGTRRAEAARPIAHTFTDGRIAPAARQPAPGQGADEWEQF